MDVDLQGGPSSISDKTFMRIHSNHFSDPVKKARTNFIDRGNNILYIKVESVTECVNKEQIKGLHPFLTSVMHASRDQFSFLATHYKLDTLSTYNV